MATNVPGPGAPPARARGGWAANILLAFVSLAVFGLLVEGLSSVLLSARSAKHALRMREESHSRYDPDLGWSHAPGVRFDDLYGRGTRFTTNRQGLRATEDYAAPAPPDRHRMVFLGDSFTMGFGVGDADTYPAQIQTLCPQVQAVNMGQGGYGVDQAYLWYKRDGEALRANTLVFAFIAHDFYRMAEPGFIGYGKPVLRVRDGRLSVENVPVPRNWSVRTPLRRARTFLDSLALFRFGGWLLGRNTQTPAREAFYGAVPEEVMQAAGLAFDDLAALTRARGQAFVLVYLPSLDILAKEPTPEARWLAAYAQRSGVPLVDLADEFSRLRPSELATLFRADDGHYSEKGNRVVAGLLLRRLGERTPELAACAVSTTAS